MSKQFVIFVNDARWHVGVVGGGSRSHAGGMPDESSDDPEGVSGVASERMFGSRGALKAGAVRIEAVIEGQAATGSALEESCVWDSETAEGDNHGSPTDKADLVAQLLRQLGYRSEPVVLAVPSEWCLAASIVTDDLPDKSRQQAMCYRLEEQLPVASENFVADFIAGDGSALGIAVPTARLTQLIDDLERRGISIEVICPTVLLAASAALAECVDTCQAIVMGHEHDAQLFWYEKGTMRHWHVTPINPTVIASRLRSWAESLAGPLTVRCINLPDECAECVAGGLAESDFNCTVTQTELPPIFELAAVGAWNIAYGERPIVNLRRDTLAVADRMRRIRAPVFTAFAAAIALLLTLSAVLFVRAQHYQHVAEELHSRTATLFEELFDEPAPNGIRLRMESRLREMKGLRGVDDRSTRPNHRPASALSILHKCLERMPTDLRFCILDIRVEPDGILLVGHARTHSDADRIAGSLRRDNAFRVDPPRTQNLKDGGVSFAVRCQLPSGAAEPEKTARLHWNELQ